MRKYVSFIFKFILFIKIINYCKLSRCNKDNPLLKEEGCISSCTTDEINNGKCLIENEIIKTQWLNNIIYIGEEKYLYINVIASENNNFYCLVSNYPPTKTRIAYILDNEGYGLSNKENPKFSIQGEKISPERLESEISIIKFNNDNKEYILSLSYPYYGMEIYDFYEYKIYCLQSEFGFLFITNKIWVNFKLNTNNNENQYIIGYINSENYPPEYFFSLKKVSFSSLDIANNPPQIESQKIESSETQIISCYDMLNNYFGCFFLNRSFKYTMIVYSYDLIEKNTSFIADVNPNKEYKNLFFKCVHFFDETGAFGYFTNNEQPIFVFQFKKYVIDSNSITNSYDSITELAIGNYYLKTEYITLLDMIKIEDKKIYFVAVSVDNNTLYIVSIFNYYNENFVKRIYSIKAKDFYDYNFSRNLRITMYKQFLVLGSNYRDLSTSTDYSSLIFFSYPNTTEALLDISNYLSLDNKIKINNLTLELKGEYIMENNLFGYIYSGIQIITNCIDLENIYLADLENNKINDNFFLSKDNIIKLYIPKNDIYEPFTCKFKYAIVVTEPEYSEYNKYPIEFLDTGVGQKEKNFFDNNKKRYIGRYSFYYLKLKEKLTEKCDIYCELCLYHNIDECITEKDCNTTNFFQSICGIRKNSVFKKDKMINNIENDIQNKMLNPLLDEIINEKKDFIVKTDDVIYQLTSTANQKKK